MRELRVLMGVIIAHLLWQPIMDFVKMNIAKGKFKILMVAKANADSSLLSYSDWLMPASLSLEYMSVENPYQDRTEVLGCLPDCKPVSKPSSIYWGRKSDGAENWLNITAIFNAHNEVTTWRKNTFLVPYGKTGRDFID